MVVGYLLIRPLAGWLRRNTCWEDKNGVLDIKAVTDSV